LPADTFAPGPPSGFAITGSTNGRAIPFASQPVQGFSAVLPQWNGHWLVMADNGFGNKANSSDFNLRWYEMANDWAHGTVQVLGYTELSDPNHTIPWTIIHENTDRILTGADFDLESFRLVADGSFWFGDEFGPYLLHTDAQGHLLEAPIPAPVPDVLAPFARGLSTIKSPDHPDFVSLADTAARRAAANLPSSKGFEGMALNTSGTKLYPLLEGALVDDPVRTRLLIQEFDLATQNYTGKTWFYPLSDAGNAIGDMTAVNDQQFLVIERDNNQNDTASFKRIYLVDLLDTDAEGMLRKRLVANLMAITDNQGLTKAEDGAIGLGSVFQFPFTTIEDVYPVDERTLLVINDNNYPFSTGRRAGIPDDNEFILLRLPDKLNLDR
ncbi:MAG: esterase-like activity of phytase family protein, partial [Oscillochloris sp.]|nr:esterase-like activity of phytase family protein [Oscillochloris sp.]